MSTRCQVEVQATDLPWNAEMVVLYHHCDGYPTGMLPIIEAAYNFATSKGGGYSWQAGRPGKTAAFVCVADPFGFDIESSTELHSDIEWFYSIECQNKNGGEMSEVPKWRISVYCLGPCFSRDKPRREDLKLVATGSPKLLVKRAKKLEEAEQC